MRAALWVLSLFLAGASTIMGAVNYITNMPKVGKDKAEGYGLLTYGRNDLAEFEGGVSLPARCTPSWNDRPSPRLRACRTKWVTPCASAAGARLTAIDPAGTWVLEGLAR